MSLLLPAILLAICFLSEIISFFSLGTHIGTFPNNKREYILEWKDEIQFTKSLNIFTIGITWLILTLIALLELEIFGWYFPIILLSIVRILIFFTSRRSALRKLDEWLKRYPPEEPRDTGDRKWGGRVRIN